MSLTKSEFLDSINVSLADNSTREISPLDLRQSFTDLANSVHNFLSDQAVSGTNISTPDTRTTILGVGALDKLGLAGRSSVDNTAIGYNTLYANYDGQNNTAVGAFAVSCNLYGGYNVGVGSHALGNNIQGSGNVGIGSFSLLTNKHGDFNIAIGHGAGHYVNDDENYQFFLASYGIDESGCSTSYESGKAPLLYGDLLDNRLGVNVKQLNAPFTVNRDTSLASHAASTSGFVQTWECDNEIIGGISCTYNDLLFGPTGIISGIIGVSGYAEAIGTGGSPYSFRMSNGAEPDDVIANAQTVYISGISGVSVAYDASSNLFTIDAVEVSGSVGGGGSYSFSVGNGETALDTISDGQSVYISGISGITVEYSADINRFVIDGDGAGTSYTAGSGLTLVGSEFNTAGTGNFNKVQLNRLQPADPSGQLVADSGGSSYASNTIVNSGGLLSVPYFGASGGDEVYSKSDIIEHSGSIMFAGAYARVTDGASVSPEPVIEGFASGLTGSHGQVAYNISAPAHYNAPTSGWIIKRDNNFLAESEPYLFINRDNTLAISGGSFIMATYVNNEYRPMWVGCSGCAG